MQITVIEDDADLAMGLRANLEFDGHTVTTAHSGEDGLREVFAVRPQMVILDLTLPGIDGYEVLAQLRRADVQTPVLLLTARSQEVDRIRGFRAGADDYVTKPFSVMELLLRVRAIAKRSSGEFARAETSSFRVGDAIVDIDRRIVRREGEEIVLSPKAFDLLAALYANRDRVVTRQQLLRDVWGYDASVTTRTVDAHVVELRRTLEPNPSEPRFILTARTVGYRLRV